MAVSSPWHPYTGNLLGVWDRDNVAYSLTIRYASGCTSPLFQEFRGENFVTGDNGHLAGENPQVIVPSDVRLWTACADQLRSPQGVMILL